MQSWSITAKVTSREIYVIQLYVIKFVSNLQQVAGFLRVLQFPSQINLTATL